MGSATRNPPNPGFVFEIQSETESKVEVIRIFDAISSIVTRPQNTFSGIN